jgi:hypothetical protein
MPSKRSVVAGEVDAGRAGDEIAERMPAVLGCRRSDRDGSDLDLVADVQLDDVLDPTRARAWRFRPARRLGVPRRSAEAS